MEPLPTSTGRGARLTLVALALFVLLAVVGFASRSGFGGSSDARPSETYINYALSIFLVLFVLAIPLTLVAFFLQAREGAVQRARGYRRIVIQNVVLFALVLIAVAFFVYLRRTRAEILTPGEKLGKAGDAARRARGRDEFEPAFQLPVLYVVIPLLVAIVVAALVAHRRRKARLRGTAKEPLTVAEELSVELTDALDDLEAEPDPRRAVIAAYARMEGALARHGLRRRPSETPHEYLRRVLLDLRAPAAAVRRLTDGFERAKFSRHEIDEGVRRDAIAALTAVRDGLRGAAAS